MKQNLKFCKTKLSYYLSKVRHVFIIKIMEAWHYLHVELSSAKFELIKLTNVCYSNAIASTIVNTGSNTISYSLLKLNNRKN